MQRGAREGEGAGSAMKAVWSARASDRPEGGEFPRKRGSCVEVAARRAERWTSAGRAKRVE